MTNETSSRIDPEPIDAEFEPTAGRHETDAGQHTRPPPRLRSHAVTLPELAIGCVAATLLGAVIAIAFTGANSGSATGTLAREIDALTLGQVDLSARAEQVGGDLVAMRSRLDSQSGRIAQREASETTLRAELTAIANQISALAGAGAGTAAPGGGASGTALGVLLSRIDKLEQTVAEDAAAPKTTRQMQRAISDLADQVATLESANAELSAALNKREAALATLTAALTRTAADLDLVRGRLGEPGAARPAGAMRMTSSNGVEARGGLRTEPRENGAPTFTTLAASADQPRMASALSALENAAQSGRPFVSQHQVLASLLPSDTDVAALRDIARSGAPTKDQLTRDLANAARVLDILSSPPADDGWNWMRHAIDVVPPHPEADAGATTAAGSIAQARRALDLGDMRGAAEALGGVAGVWTETFSTWRDQTSRRADLDARLSSLGTRIHGEGSAS